MWFAIDLCGIFAHIGVQFGNSSELPQYFASGNLSSKSFGP
jgi:hypothetical protein